MSSPPASHDLAPVDAARSLCASGRAQEAIELLTAVNRSAPDRALEEELVRLRHLAFDQLPLGGATGAPIVPAPDGPGLLEREPAELSLELVGADLGRHGCVLVRGLLGADQVARLVDGIDRAFDAFDAGLAGAPVGDTSPWYAPFTPQPGRYRIGGRKRWMRDGGGMWTADSPRMLFVLLELFEDLGLRELIGSFLGERPALSANKCNLRRVPVTTSTNWHQDGAFLGADVRSLNVWMSLSHCGIDAPGLDIVPRRLDRVLETGTEGALFDWSVSPAVVKQVGTPVLRPELAPGDALLFDHLFLHRTGVSPGMTRERYAIESWFFAPSSYPEGQIPVVF